MPCRGARCVTASSCAPVDPMAPASSTPLLRTPAAEAADSQEEEEVFELFAGFELVFDAFHRLREIEVGPVEELVGLAEDGANRGRDAMAAEADGVEVH